MNLFSCTYSKETKNIIEEYTSIVPVHMQKSPPLNIASLVLVVFFFPVTLNLHARVQITSYWRAFWLVGLLNVECTRKFSQILRCYSTCSPLCYNVFAFLVQLSTGTFFCVLAGGIKRIFHSCPLNIFWIHPMKHK